ncbi:VWA domain-containing protein [Treponema vincentii]|uniref:vWA domain-containing protein n=1 Tax=Treponema vincentii TaxID=69710 RepID=UPI0020A38930|nr:vWA domain-containing protein [Treponema vincentii]UTC60921.1 VWA domain-containing protein [Treponema vincentii]
MKKIRIFAGITFFFLIISALNAQTVRNETADVIVLMDTSGTVLPYYEVINQRVLQSIISKFVRIGDSFHLISFSAVPRYEMSQKINTEADLSRVVSRFMLLYQLGQSADFLSGINFAGQYMAELPSQQEKILIVISDGIFNPPASSPYRNYSGEQVKMELAKISASIRAHGWKVYYVKLPFPSDAVIKDLDGAFYEGKLDATGSLDRSGVDSTANSSRASSGSTGGNAGSRQGGASNTGTTTGNNTQTAGTVVLPADAAAKQTGTTTPSGNQNASTAQAAQGTADSSGTADRGNYSNSGTGSNTYNRNEANASATSDAASQNTGSTESDGGQFASTGAGSADQPPKEYTDVSQAFTENLGIEPSPLPEEGGIEFSDTVQPIPQIVFPERIETSGAAAELPLTIINDAEEAVEVQLKSISVGADGESQKQQLNNITVSIPPKGKSELTIRITLPDSLRSEGQHRTDIRLDLVQQDKTFSQAAAVLVSVTPTFIQSLLSGNLIWILLAALILLVVLIFIFILRRRASEPVKYAARMVGQQSDLNRQNNTVRQTDFNREQRPVLTASEKKYYPEQLGDKADPRDTLNTFGSQTAAAAAATKTETAAQFDYLARQQSRTAEGRFALLNSAENYIDRRPGLNRGYYSGRISTKPSQSGMTELFVYNQNTSIGKRNIHVMKPGSRLSIGGSKSDDFLIFLVPFPANLAQVQYDGSDYRVSILKPEYFPYETSNTIYQCIGRDITAVSKKGYHVTFTFRGYEDPMIKLNTILTSINYTEER